MSHPGKTSEHFRPLDGVAKPTDSGAIDGLGSLNQPDDETNKRLNEIEMLGEEAALGWSVPHPVHGVTAGLRYLHCSRTINQLVIDRNRCVTIYLAVASLLWTATSAFSHITPEGRFQAPLQDIKDWCVPITASVLATLALLVALLLIRIRVGLIYEVAKMNVLLGLPVGRVRRVNPLSVFFIMYLLIALAGGVMTATWCYFLLHLFEWSAFGLPVALGAGVGATVVLVTGYVVSVRWLTADPRLLDGAGAIRPEGPRPAMGSVLY